ncbi:hypothetical protein HD806DRAFT_499726 [Xylariaceae sp. AK1471]|nr:hypothetical protein HD806DRAFT_499726 [Xylariaceae sp. AK1471]
MHPVTMADRAMVDVVPPHAVIEFTFSDRNTDSEIIVMCNGKRLVIRLFADSFDESPPLKERYLFFLHVAEEFEIDGFTVEDFYDWVMEPFFPILRDLPPLKAGAVPTLQDFFFPDTRFFTLRAVTGRLVPFPDITGDDDDDEFGYGVRLPNELCSRWHCLAPSDLEICAKRPEEALSKTPQRVRPVGASDIFFLKLVRRGDGQFTKRELSNYEKIDNAGLEEELFISRLHGLVRNASDLIVGFLLTDIDCKATTLACAANPDVPISLRRKWADQVKSTVERLHAVGIIWGDVKAANVLVDVNNDAWVVDFGGGYTEGWVDKELAGTVAGDLQGLTKIISFLGL